MGHAGLYLTLYLRVSTKAEGIPTLQQSSFFPKVDGICPLWETESKNGLNVS